MKDENEAISEVKILIYQSREMCVRLIAAVATEAFKDTATVWPIVPDGIPFPKLMIKVLRECVILDLK